VLRLLIGVAAARSWNLLGSTSLLLWANMITVAAKNGATIRIELNKSNMALFH